MNQSHSELRHSFRRKPPGTSSYRCRSLLRSLAHITVSLVVRGQGGGFRNCPQSTPNVSFPGGGYRDLRSIAQCLSSCSSRRTYRELSSRPTPCSQRGQHQRGPTARVRALDRLARSPCRTTSFLESVCIQGRPNPHVKGVPTVNGSGGCALL